jgi:hypothetical protein
MYVATGFQAGEIIVEISSFFLIRQYAQLVLIKLLQAASQKQAF